NQLMDPGARDSVRANHTYAEAVAVVEPVAAASSPATVKRSAKVRTGIPIPAAPYLERRLRDVPHLAEVWSYINPYMLYGKNLGYKGNFEKDMAQHVPLALELFHKVEDLKREAAEFMK